MITYLLAVGYTSQLVGVARVGSSIFEISATWIAPYLTKKIGVVRAGIWSLTWQMACLSGALGWYFSGVGGMGTEGMIPATGLAVGVAMSRMGLWGFDLCAQNIIQDVSPLQNFDLVSSCDRLTDSAIGSGGLSPRNLLCCRSFISKPLRDVVLPDNDHLLSARSVQVATGYQCGSCLYRRWLVCLFLKEAAWASFPFTAMHPSQGVV